MAPPGFGRAKANVAVKQQQEQNNGTMANSTNIPLLQANSTGRWVGGEMYILEISGIKCFEEFFPFRLFLNIIVFLLLPLNQTNSPFYFSPDE